MGLVYMIVSFLYDSRVLSLKIQQLSYRDCEYGSVSSEPDGLAY